MLDCISKKVCFEHIHFPLIGDMKPVSENGFIRSRLKGIGFVCEIVTAQLALNSGYSPNSAQLSGVSQTLTRSNRTAPAGIE